jgi:hypothetical protein
MKWLKSDSYDRSIPDTDWITKMNRFVLLFATMAVIGLAAQPRAADRPKFDKLQFDSELIRIYIEPDSVRVDGLYYLLSRFPVDPSQHLTLFYPYPEDSLLGGARTLLLECGTPGSASRPTRFTESRHLAGARWWVPMLADTVVMRTVYRQALKSRYARYIVTTTKSWGQPLKRARFEIYLPENAKAPEFSFPFSRASASDSSVYVYETTDFMPDEDIIVTWR